MTAKFTKSIGYLLLFGAAAVTVGYAEPHSEFMQALALVVFALGAASLTFMQRRPRSGNRSSGEYEHRQLPPE